MSKTITPDLANFASKLVNNWLVGSDEALRLPETQAKYREIVGSFTQQQRYDYIMQKLDANAIVLMESEFPYDLLIPDGSPIRHYIIWFQQESDLIQERIHELLETVFPDQSWFVFRNPGKFISVEYLPHVHAIVHPRDELFFNIDANGE